jgi:3-oxoacyl-[acyl-carrier protein] reductase
MKNQSILVIGASGSIGSAVAYDLANAGYSLGLHYCTNQHVIKSITTDLGKKNLESLILQSKLASEKDCQDTIDQCAERFGSLYGLAICSGRVPWKHWEVLQAHDWYESYFEHCVVPFLLVNAALKKFNTLRRIVYLSSISSKYGGSDLTLHYASAKSALETSMRGMSKKLVHKGVRINGVRAGFVDTPQQRLGRSEQSLAERISRIPVGRGGTPAEIASAFGYLFSEYADFIAGEIITVAGGD